MSNNLTVAAGLLILSALIFLPGGLLFTGRVIWKAPAAQSRRYLYWERGVVMAAALSAALGFVLLAQLLQDAGEDLLAPLALAILLIGTTLTLVAESLNLQTQQYYYVPMVLAVILLFVSQAAFGASILQSHFLPGWVGWAALIWNIAWLIILPVARPRDMYYPWLHYVAPLIIGIALLAGR